MAKKFSLAQEMKIPTALEPAADAGGRTAASAVSLKNCGKAGVLFHINQGNAATILLTVLQATAVAKTGGKALANNVPIWVNLDCAASDTWVRAADGVNYTTDAGVKIKQVFFEIDPAMLDVAGGFDCIYCSTGASNAANITAAQYVLMNLRYAQATPPSALTD